MLAFKRPTDHGPDPRPPLGSVVVATDFTAHARAALDRALRLPLGIGASLDLLHVLGDEGGPRPDEQAEARRLLDQARDEAARALAAPREGGVDIVTSLDHGAPPAVIADRAHHGRAELVVLGRHGERQLRDSLIGSTAERVIRGGSVSVLVVAGPPAGPYRRPLVAVDLSDSSRLALELAARLSDPGLDEIDVLHVAAAPGGWHAGAPERLGDPEREARAELAAFVATVNAGVRWRLAVELGDPLTAILGEAKRRGADLVALGTKGRTGLAHVLLGSVAGGVVRGAGCDVLVARLPGRP